MTTPLDISDFVYQTGTLTIAAGDTTAVFSGTSLSANVKDGDYLFAGGSLAVIETVTDDTHVELFTDWAGSDVTAGTYVILKASMLRNNAVQIGYDSTRFISMLDNLSVLYAVAGDAPDPSIGEEGNLAFKMNVTPWQAWLKTGGVWVEQTATHSIAEKGDKVDKGDKGDKGDNGDAGDAGAPGTNGADGEGVPVGGSSGQILSKINSTNYNTEWVDLPAPTPTSLLLNRLINGNGRINQRGITSAADDVYAWDRHYVLTQTAAIGTSTLSDVADGLPSMMRLTQSQSTAQRMGVVQIIESVNCRDLRGKTVSLLGKLRCSASQAIRYAILEWTGTADAVTSDVVSSWTNGTFTAGQFFNSTTLTVTAVGTITPSSATLTDFLLSATVGSSANNLIVMVWTEGTAAQTATLDVAWEFLKGDLTGLTFPLTRRQFGEEVLLCQRYFQKTCPLDTTPAAGVADGCINISPLAATGYLSYHYRFQVSMRATPTVTTYNPWSGGTSGYWTNASANASSQPLVASTGTDACVIYLNNAVSQAWTSQGWQITVTLSAEL